MKQVILLSMVFLLHGSFAFSAVYNYEFKGLITFSDYWEQNGFDPFIEIPTAFSIFGMWGDLGEEAYCEIEEEIYHSLSPTPLFELDSTEDFDVIYYRLAIDHPLGIWHIHGLDSSKELISDDGSVNWDLFGDLDWQILWIAVNHNDPDLPEYWEYDGLITSVSLNVTPVPEPATVLVLGFGIVGLGLIRWRNSSINSV
ncbi:PEP-CTERM sorting domain-containing protein [Desulfosediminicola sp.]|uniref:PEP-CTERM sorting domain-containing protein n=1 Tax=Desulfosediminicola sp. TaxID=2886825 RepID=UPI003AF2BF7E